MAKHASNNAAKLDQGKNLARQLYDLKLRQLEKIDEAQRKTYLSEYPLLGEVEFNDVRRQVIQAKTAQQMQVGWYSIPHDITVIVFVLVTWSSDLRLGIVAGVAALVLFESIFQFYFDPQYYRRLSLLVWMTYPAYALLAWVLYSRGFAWYWIAAAVVGVWGGTYLAALVARYPMQLIMKARIEAAKRKAREAAEAKKKKPDDNVLDKS